MVLSESKSDYESSNVILFGQFSKSDKLIKIFHKDDQDWTDSLSWDDLVE